MTFSSPAAASSEKIPKKLRAILRFVYQNRFSDFYRKKFNAVGINLKKINTVEDFRKLPFTTKEEFINNFPEDLCFLSPKEVDFVRFSSGTSGKGLSVVYRSSALEKRSARLLASFFKPVSKVFILMGSANRTIDQYCRWRSLGKLTIIGDVNNLEAAALLVLKTRSDALSTTPSLALFLGEKLKKYDGLARIKIVYLHGEGLSPHQFDAIKRLYSDGVIFSTAGSTETSGIFAYQCKYLSDKASSVNIFHPAPYFYFENLNGEIVLTSLYRSPLMLVRYRTGDMGEQKNIKCACGESKLISILGRVGGDVIKAWGMEFRKSALLKAQGTLEAGVKMITLHLSEENVGESIKPKVVFEVVLKNDRAPSAELKSEILLLLKNNFWVSQKHNIFDAVRAGLMLEPEIKFSENAAPLSQIVDHRF